MMERQVGHMVRLVDDLLDVSRISRGKIELRTSTLELSSVVEHATEAARPPFEKLGQELTIALPSQPLHLDGDPVRLAQVVGKLLDNASKFTPQGGHVSLALERVGEQALLRVRDSGVGIAPEQLPRIFEMFTQVDTALERSQSGLGIGLTLVRELVELHGGSVEVRSEGVGRGSEFLVRLPLAPQSALPARAPLAGDASLRCRVLVVDDNRDSVETLTLLLEDDGHTVQQAYDGREAVALAATFRPDVVLLDIGLPMLNGYEAARQMRAQPWGTSMTLVALTGWGQDEDRRRSRDAGFDAHLVKPVEYRTLAELLARLAGARHGV